MQSHIEPWQDEVKLSIALLDLEVWAAFPISSQSKALGHLHGRRVDGKVNRHGFTLLGPTGPAKGTQSG